MAYRNAVGPEEAEAIIAQYFDDRLATVPMVIDKEPVCDEEGHPIMHEVWLKPPTVAGIALALGVDKFSFLRWCENEKSPYNAIAKAAKQRIEEYLEERLDTARQTDGVKFNLTNNFKESWKEKQEIEIGEETRKSEAFTAISLREKLELIITASEKARATMKRAEAEASDAGSGDDKD